MAEQQLEPKPPPGEEKDKAVATWEDRTGAEMGGQTQMQALSPESWPCCPSAVLLGRVLKLLSLGFLSSLVGLIAVPVSRWESTSHHAWYMESSRLL